MTHRRTFFNGDPDATITSQQMEHQLDDINPQACVLFSHSPSVQVYYALRSRLESCSEAWLQEFVELDGLDSFLDCLGHMTGPTFTGFSDAILQIDCLSCIRAVLNSHVGMSTLVNSQDGIWKLLKDNVDIIGCAPLKSESICLHGEEPPVCAPISQTWDNGYSRKPQVLYDVTLGQQNVFIQHTGLHTLEFTTGKRKQAVGVDLVNTLPRKIVLEILSAVCTYNKRAYTQLLKALDRHKKENHLYHRFSFIINELKMAETVPQKTTVLTLINSIICSTSDINERCRIRNEFIGLTLLDVLAFLRREDPDEDLYIQLQVFQTKKHEDESVLDLESNLDLSSPQDLADAIQTRVFGKPKMVSFVNILQDLLAVEVSGKDQSDKLWQVLERHIHHIVHGTSDINTFSQMDTESVCQAVTTTLGPSSGPQVPIRKTSPADLQIKNLDKQYLGLDRDKNIIYQICPSCVKNGGGAAKVSADSGYVGNDDRFSPESYLCGDNNQSPKKRIKRSSSCGNENPEKPSPDETQKKFLDMRGDCVNKGRLVSMYDNTSPWRIPPQPDSHRRNKDLRGHDKMIGHNLRDVRPSPDKASAVVHFGNAQWRVPDCGNGVTDKSPRSAPYSSPSNHSFLNFQRNRLAFPAYVMRNLKWIKLDEGTVGLHPHSLWAETDTCHLRVEPDFLHLEEMFREKYVFDETAETALLNGKTRLSLNLFLNRLEEEPTVLVKTLGHLDGPGLALPFIRHLVEILPEHSEIKHLKYYNGNLLNLGPAEQFVLHLFDLPDYRTLLTGQLRRAEFAVTVPHLHSVLESMLETSRSILASKSLQEILMLVLRLGNFLNHGQYNGYASGFKLSSLSRLSDMKSREAGHNFVHFLVSVLDSSDDKLLDFLAEIPQLEKAASCSPADVKCQFDKLNTQINSFIRQLSSASSIIKDGFSGFMEEVKKEFRLLQGQITELKIQSQHLSEYFCEAESFDIQTCFRQLLEFFKQLRLCRQEVQLMKRQKIVASRHSSMFTEQIRTKHLVFKFGLEAGASSSIREEKKQLVELILTELHRGNFKVNTMQPSSPSPQRGADRTQIAHTPTRKTGPSSCPATPDRDLNLADLSHISVLGTPMVNRPNSELFADDDDDDGGDDATITELKAATKIITSSVRHLADVTAPPAVGPTMLPPVFSLQHSLVGSHSRRSKTHHRSKSDLADSISATTKWIRYHQQSRLEGFQAPLARPESSIMLATLNLEAGKRRLTQQVAALVPGPTIELPPSRDHADVGQDSEVFELVRNGRKGERKSGAFSNFFNKISKRVLRQRSNSDQNSGGKSNGEVVSGETCVGPAEVARGKAKMDKTVSKAGLVGKNPGVVVTKKPLTSTSSAEDKENVCDQDYNPFDRQKKNPIRLSNRFKGKLAK